MISFVYFDVGGVVIFDLSLQENWDQYKKDIGLKEKYYDEFDQLWDDMDPKLNIDTAVDSLIPVIEERFEINFPENFSLQADFVQRFRKNESIWPIVDQVKKTYSTGLLTNMYPGMLQAIHDGGLMPQISWDVIVDSSVVGFQKPDRKIYEVAQKMANTKPNEILFIDNTPRNVLAAKESGWNAFLYDQFDVKKSNRDLMKLLNSQ